MNLSGTGTGFNDHPDGTMVLTVSEQHDYCAGQLTVIKKNATLATGNFAGAVSRDGTV